MSWEIFLGIVALVGFIITVSTPMIKLNTSITKLNDTIDSLRDSVEKNEKHNKESHERIYSRLDNHEAAIHSHSEQLMTIKSENDRKKERIDKIEKATSDQESRLIRVETTVSNLKA